MTTLAALLIGRCGLSHREAADVLGVRLDTVKSWSSGRNPMPPGAVDELRALYARIERTATEAVAVVSKRGAGVDVVELGLAADDAEAQALGWPCVGAHAAALGVVAARLDKPARVVLRGSTISSIAAACAHGVD